MFSFFRRRNWQPELIPELSGSHDGLIVRLRHFPCRVDEADGTRRYVYPEFGSDFIYELLERQLGDFDRVRQTLATHASTSVLVRVRDLPPIKVEIAGYIPAHRDQFYSNVSDALIDAFKSHGIRA